MYTSGGVERDRERTNFTHHFFVNPGKNDRSPQNGRIMEPYGMYWQFQENPGW